MGPQCHNSGRCCGYHCDGSAELSAAFINGAFMASKRAERLFVEAVFGVCGG